MIPKNYILSPYSFIVALCASFLITSCGSYQYVGYENDGIYSSDEVVYEDVPNNVSTETNSSSYYKQYFDEKSNEIDSQEEIIFTDIDSYEGNYTEEIDTLEYNTGYAGWGQNSSEIQIVYNNYRPWNSYGYYGFGDPYFGGYYGGYYGGFNNWSRPYWSIGFGSFYPNYGYGYGYGNGFGYGYGNGFGYGYGYNYGRYPYHRYGYPYYGNRDYGTRYHGNSYSYNTGRRSSSSTLDRNYQGRTRENISRSNTRSRVSSDGIIRRPSASINNNNSNTRQIMTRDGRRTVISRPQSTNDRAVRPNTQTRQRVNTTTTRSSNPRATSPVRSRTNNNGQSRTNNNIQRSSTPSRSSNNNIQRSSSPNRSSGVNRSSRSTPSRSSGNVPNRRDN